MKTRTYLILLTLLPFSAVITQPGAQGIELLQSKHIRTEKISGRPQGPSGRKGTARTFRGGDYMEFKRGSQNYWKSKRGPFTVSLWVKFDSPPNWGTGVFGSRPGNHWFGQGFTFTAFPGRHKPKQRVRVEVNMSDDMVHNSNAIIEHTFPLGEWRHLVVVMEPDAKATYYMDMAATEHGDITRFKGSFDPGKNFRAGTFRRASGTTFHLDDIRIFHRALRPGEIKKLYAHQKSRPDSHLKLAKALERAKNHLEGRRRLSGRALTRVQKTIKLNMPFVDRDFPTAQKAIRLVRSYESRRGHLWKGPERLKERIVYKKLKPMEKIIYDTQQGVFDHVFKSEWLDRLQGVGFKAAEVIPGLVKPGTRRVNNHTALVDGTHRASFPENYRLLSDPIRMPTGIFAAPGDILTLRVPGKIVGKGFLVAVGAHFKDLTHKPYSRRFPRITKFYPINSRNIKVANPLGGGVYILVPPGARAGVFTVKLSGGVKMPFFSLRSFDVTDLERWNREIRHYGAPAADLFSDRIYLQLPAAFVRNWDKPHTTLRNWDRAMKGFDRIYGRPTAALRAEGVLLDVEIPGGAFGVGYPYILANWTNNHGHPGYSALRLGITPGFEKQNDFQVIFHEMTHGYSPTTLPGEVEAIANFTAVYIYHQALGLFKGKSPSALDHAFVYSGHQHLTLAQAAVDWMISPNFQKNKPMNNTGSEANEIRYQSRAYAKYAELSVLFGWPLVSRVFHTYHKDQIAFRKKHGRRNPRTSSTWDQFILRSSRQANQDLRAFLHFWGLHPSEKLNRKMDAMNLPKSDAAYFRLQAYKQAAPKNNEDFRKHYDQVIKTIDPVQSKRYRPLRRNFSARNGAAIRRQIDRIIRKYYGTYRPRGSIPARFNFSRAGATTKRWSKCAPENGTCTVSGNRGENFVLRYGTAEKAGAWLYKKTRGGERVPCTNGHFRKDPAPGIFKACFLLRVQGEQWPRNIRFN